ncbi:MAG: STAS/SEC14 domain-containing protein [Thermaerobacter sp.]|nr:hypothetical protein [Bacillota bacterium]REJ37227.1 MAG: hypothetical protein DIU84_04810 [Bacillota bacterium]
MYKVQLLDPERRIIELVWSGKVQPEEVEEVNQKFLEIIKSFDGKPFDALVDLSTLISFPPETQRGIAEQQKMALEKGLRRSAVVVPSGAVRAGLNTISNKSGLQTEFHFASRQEALAFLQSDQ